MFHKYYAEYKNILLRPLVHADIEQLRIWRNNVYETRFLRQIGFIDSEKQERWFKNYLLKKNDIIFAIEETQELKRLVGSVSLYNISESQAEFGRIQIGDAEAHGKGIGKTATAMSLAFGFEKLNLKKITACVHRDNIAAYSIYMKVGFAKTGLQASEVGGEEYLIEIDRSAFLNKNKCIGDIVFGELNLN